MITFGVWHKSNWQYVYLCGITIGKIFHHELWNCYIFHNLKNHCKNGHPTLKEAQKALTGPEIIYCKDCGKWGKLKNPINESFDDYGRCALFSHGASEAHLFVKSTHYCAEAEAVIRPSCHHEELELHCKQCKKAVADVKTLSGIKYDSATKNT